MPRVLLNTKFERTLRSHQNYDDLVALNMTVITLIQGITKYLHKKDTRKRILKIIMAHI